MTTTLAQNLLSAFYTRTIDDTTKVVINTDHEHAETVKAMVFAADQSGLGWDFAYEAVRDCLQYLMETDADPRDDVDFDPDEANLTDSYDAALVHWLASSAIKHLALCDEAESEAGGFTNDETLSHRIATGQRYAYTLAYGAVASNWPDTDKDA